MVFWKPAALAGALALFSCSGAPFVSMPASAATIDGVERITLPLGTEIPLQTEQELSSKTNAKGYIFELVVTQDVVRDGRVAIPKGSRAVGELSHVVAKGAFGRSGKLEARLLYLVVNDHTIRLGGRLGRRGEGGTTETVLTAVAVGTLAFIVTGKSAVIPAGTLLSGYLDRDAEIPVQR